MSCSTRRRILQRVELEKLHCHGSLPCNIQFPWFRILVFVDARFKRMLLDTRNDPFSTHLHPRLVIRIFRDIRDDTCGVQLDLLLRNELRGRETGAPLYIWKSVTTRVGCHESTPRITCHVLLVSQRDTQTWNAIIGYIIFRVSCEKMKRHDEMFPSGIDGN